MIYGHLIHRLNNSNAWKVKVNSMIAKPLNINKRNNKKKKLYQAVIKEN